MAGTIWGFVHEVLVAVHVSMESGLDGRNNHRGLPDRRRTEHVSMESGLDGRNNGRRRGVRDCPGGAVSMESGLDGRNNLMADCFDSKEKEGLNGVRPRWPEQSACGTIRPGSAL